MRKTDPGRFTLTASSGLMPKEEMLEVSKTNQRQYIGLPAECTLQENRVALVPEAVARLVNNGHEVVVETNAGQGAHYEDRDFSEAGAKIAYDREEVYKAEIIIKVDPPTLEEINWMKPGQTLISALQLSVQPENYLKQLLKKQVTAIAVDFIRDKDGGYPFVRSMSEIAGNTVISHRCRISIEREQRQGPDDGRCVGRASYRSGDPWCWNGGRICHPRGTWALAVR
jgi:alanine dehydrogenase